MWWKMEAPEEGKKRAKDETFHFHNLQQKGRPALLQRLSRRGGIYLILQHSSQNETWNRKHSSHHPVSGIVPQCDELLIADAKLQVNLSYCEFSTSTSQTHIQTYQVKQNKETETKHGDGDTRRPCDMKRAGRGRRRASTHQREPVLLTERSNEVVPNCRKQTGIYEKTVGLAGPPLEPCSPQMRAGSYWAHVTAFPPRSSSTVESNWQGNVFRIVIFNIQISTVGASISILPHSEGWRFIVLSIFCPPHHNTDSLIIVIKLCRQHMTHQEEKTH